MPRFIALPVGQGDAFYLDRYGWSVLVDGGRSKDNIGLIFQSETGARKVDILVCTHNDADHANGVLGYLASGLRCKELWLPGRWLGVLPDVLRPFVEVVGELANEVCSESWLVDFVPSNGTAIFDAFLQRTAHQKASDPPKSGQEIDRGGWPECLLEILENAEPWGELCRLSPAWGPSFESVVSEMHGFGIRFGFLCRQFLWEAIDAGQRIRDIALEAFHRGVPVRWFEFDPINPGGGCDQLRPLNSKAIACLRKPATSLLCRLALTISNKESLVFWSPPIDGPPGVLFTADSDLGNVNLSSSLFGAIVTAPHHGSETNASAYSCVEKAAAPYGSSLNWVRSDGRYSSRPGDSYLVAPGRKLCTLCRRRRGDYESKKAVHLFARAGKWVRHRDSAECTCEEL